MTPDEPVIEAAPVPANRVVAALLEFDRKVEGRRTRLLIGAAVVQAVLAPAIDRAMATLRDTALLGATARDLGSVSFAGFAALSLLSSISTLSLAAMILGGRAVAFASSHDAHGLRALFQEARSVVGAEWAILTRKGGVDATVTAGAVTYVALAATRDVLRLFRFVMWEGPISWFGLDDTFVATPLLWVYQLENLFEFGILLSALAAVIGVTVWALQPPRIVQTSQVLSARMASTLPHVVDVRDSAAINKVSSLFHGDVVGRTLRSLSDWRSDELISDEAELHRKLRYHFASQGFSVGSEVWIGKVGRVDLVLDDVVVIELKYGRLRANERNRVMGQSTTYANNWTGRGPVIVVCVNTPEERLHEVSQSVVAWNRSLPDKEHLKEGLPAPIIVMNQVGDRTPMFTERQEDV